MRLLVLELIALLISLLIIFIICAAFVIYAGEKIEQEYQIDKEHLGTAFFLMGAVFASLFISLPLSILIHVYIFRIFYIRRKKYEW